MKIPILVCFALCGSSLAQVPNFLELLQNIGNGGTASSPSGSPNILDLLNLLSVLNGGGSSNTPLLDLVTGNSDAPTESSSNPLLDIISGGGKGGKGKGKAGKEGKAGKAGKGGKGENSGLFDNLSNLLTAQGRSLDRHGKGGKGKGGKEGKAGKGKGGKDGKGGKGGSILDNVGNALSSLPGLDILGAVLSALAAIAPAVAGGTALAAALGTLFPTAEVTRVASLVPNPTIDLAGFLSSSTVSSLIQALTTGDIAGLLMSLATLAGSLIMQLITEAVQA